MWIIVVGEDSCNFVWLLSKGGKNTRHNDEQLTKKPAEGG